MKNKTRREIIRYGHNFKQTSHHTGARKNQNRNSGAIVCQPKRRRRIGTKNEVQIATESIKNNQGHSSIHASYVKMPLEYLW